MIRDDTSISLPTTGATSVFARSGGWERTSFASLDAGQADFAGVLGRAQTRADAGGITKGESARSAAQELVAIAFVQPVLKQAREARAGEGPFGVTQAERQFGDMLDSMTAANIVKSSNWGLVDRLAQDMLKRTAA
jgi:Rod binding domain-containing protein